MAIPENVLGKLIDAANASRHAYCRYSHFPVGAAVLADGGEIFAGCNVENASYGLTICADAMRYSTPWPKARPVSKRSSCTPRHQLPAPLVVPVAK